jgi:hypothetical protein
VERVKKQVIEGKDNGEWEAIFALRMMNKIEKKYALAPISLEETGTNEC